MGFERVFYLPPFRRSSATEGIPRGDDGSKCGLRLSQTRESPSSTQVIATKRLSAQGVRRSQVGRRSNRVTIKARHCLLTVIISARVGI